MSSKLVTLQDAGQMLKGSKLYLVAGDEKLLRQLPTGKWIGGTIPYFMSEQGGVVTQDKVFVTELPDYCQLADISFYDEKTVSQVYVKTPENGFSYIILPATSSIHASYAMNAPTYKDFAVRPVLGWISGVHLNDLGKITPKVFNGQTGEASENKAIVMSVKLPTDRVCDMGIINIFKQGNGDQIEFLEPGFLVKDVLVNGQKKNFADYLTQNKIDVKNPLVANYGGAMINVSFQAINDKDKTVSLYAPVFTGTQYKLAAPIQNYVESFTKNLPQNADQIACSCNCILNFLYSELEGKKTGAITGPITFGEVAYQLLNQTMVYLTIQKI